MSNTDQIPDTHVDRWMRGDPSAIDLPRALAGRRGEDALALAADRHGHVPQHLVDYAAGKLVVLRGADADAAIDAGVPHRPASIGSVWCDRTRRARPMADGVVTTGSEAVRIGRRAIPCVGPTGPICHPAAAT